MTTGVRSGSVWDNSSQPIPLSVAVAMMGLDLEELEQCFQVLYSVYATNMRQNKEAAQVAI